MARIAKGLAKNDENISALKMFYSKDMQSGAVIFEGPALVVNQMSHALLKLMKTIHRKNAEKVPTFYIVS
jgi:hypothetical protein